MYLKRRRLNKVVDLEIPHCRGEERGAVRRMNGGKNAACAHFQKTARPTG